MKILVFGKDGQLGKAFQEELSLLSLVLFAQPVIRYVGRSECDLANEEVLIKLLNQFQPQLIINASAYTAVDRAETEPDLAFAINARAPEIMAQYTAHHDGTLLHYSTDYVFDGEKYGYYLEDDLCNPLGVYGKSKAAGEVAIVKSFLGAPNGALNAVGQYAIFRSSWMYGDGENFISTILHLAKEREELRVIDNQYGVPTCAQWLVQVSLGMVLNGDGRIKKFPSGIYHAVLAGETTWHGLASLAVQVALDAGVTLKAHPGAIQPILAVEYPLPAPRPMNSRMSTDKLHRVFEGQGDMSKLEQLNQPWDKAVRSYVTNLAIDGLI